ncbi:hypothetical protein PZA11_006244, partial [Diplocarpon coronariae]
KFFNYYYYLLLNTTLYSLYHIGQPSYFTIIITNRLFYSCLLTNASNIILYFAVLGFFMQMDLI